MKANVELADDKKSIVVSLEGETDFELALLVLLNHSVSTWDMTEDGEFMAILEHRCE